MTARRAFLLPLVLALAAAAGSSAGQTPPPTAAPATNAGKAADGKTVRRIVPKSGVVVLPKGVALSDVRVVGRDLVVKLPDGSEMIIVDGAVFVPNLEVGGVEIPASSLAALLVGDEPRPAAGYPGGGGGGGSNVATRMFVPAKYNDFKAFGAVGMIAFSHMPATVQESKRYERICQAYVTTLADSIVMREQDPDLRQMVTIWPRTDISAPLRTYYVPSPAVAAEQCRPALRSYAYAAAEAWLARVPKRASLNRSNRGPFLIAWAPPSAIGKPNSALLIYDLSAFEDQNGIQKALGIWKKEIEDDPALWNKGWNIARWKARTAANLDRYGTQISSAISMVPWLKS